MDACVCGIKTNVKCGLCGKTRCSKHVTWRAIDKLYPRGRVERDATQVCGCCHVRNPQPVIEIRM